MSNAIQIFRQSLINRAYQKAIALGFVPEADDNVKYGASLAISVAHTVWAGADVLPIYIFPVDAGELLTFVAGVGDTVPVIIVGLAPDGTPQEETVILTAGVPVDSVKKFRAVNRAFVAGNVATVNRVLITGETSGNLLATIEIDDQQTLQAPYVVPVDKVIAIDSLLFTLNKAVGADIDCPIKLKIQKPGGVFRTQKRLGAQKAGNTAPPNLIRHPMVLPPLTKITIEAVPAGAADVSVEYGFDLYDVSIFPPAFLDKIANN